LLRDDVGSMFTCVVIGYS